MSKPNIPECLYQVVDSKTNTLMGPPLKTLAAANRKVDRLDGAYGAYRYTVRRIYKEEQK